MRMKRALEEKGDRVCTENRSEDLAVCSGPGLFGEPRSGTGSQLSGCSFVWRRN